MAFDEWFKDYNEKYGLPPAQVVAKAAWEAGREAMMNEQRESWMDYIGSQPAEPEEFDK